MSDGTTFCSYSSKIFYRYYLCPYYNHKNKFGCYSLSKLYFGGGEKNEAKIASKGSIKIPIIIS